MESKLPTANKQSQKEEKSKTLEEKRMAQTVEWFASKGLSENQSAEQSEKVGAQVCSFSGTAQ